MLTDPVTVTRHCDQRSQANALLDVLVDSFGAQCEANAAGGHSYSVEYSKKVRKTVTAAAPFVRCGRHCTATRYESRATRRSSAEVQLQALRCVSPLVASGALWSTAAAPSSLRGGNYVQVMKEIHDKTEKRLLDYHKFFKGQTEVFKKEADMFFNAVQVGPVPHRSDAESRGT